MVKVGFSTNFNLLAPGAWLIRTWLKRPFSHVYLRFNIEGVDCVFHATGKGLHLMPYAKFTQSVTVIKEFDLAVGERTDSALKRLCLINASTNYGYWQNMGLVLERLFKLSVNPFAIWTLWPVLHINHFTICATHDNH